MLATAPLLESNHGEYSAPMPANGLSPIVANMEEYADYMMIYHAVQELVIHAFTVDEGVSTMHAESLVMAMGGWYVPGQTELASTLPDSAGQSTIFGTDGGAAVAQNLSLLPVSQPFTAQSGSSACNLPLYYYGALMADVTQHSGIAAEMPGFGGPVLLLIPDTVKSTGLGEETRPNRRLLTGARASRLLSTVLGPLPGLCESDRAAHTEQRASLPHRRAGPEEVVQPPCSGTSSYFFGGVSRACRRAGRRGPGRQGDPCSRPS